jgi:hypothetical protein
LFLTSSVAGTYSVELKNLTFAFPRQHGARLPKAIALPVALLVLTISNIEFRGSSLAETIQFGRNCFKEAYFPDKLTGGVINVQKLEPGVNQYSPAHSGLESNPVSLRLTFAENKLKVSNSRSILVESSHQSFAISPQIKSIQVSRCYSPVNFGENLDNRNLGIRLL